MAATPKKIQILNNLQTVLSGINGKDPYHYSVTVLDPGQGVDDIGETDYPVILINEWPDGVNYRFLGTGFTLTTSNIEQDADSPGYHVSVSTFMKKEGQSTDNLFERYIKHEYDIIYAVLDNPDLNGTCDMAFPIFRKFYEDWQESYALLDIIFQINYDFGHDEI